MEERVTRANLSLRVIIPAALTATLLSILPSSRAALTTNTYTAAFSGPWDFAPNWSAGAPAIGNAACLITNAGPKMVLIGDGTAAASLIISNLGVSAPLAGLNTLAIITTNTFTVLQNIGIGSGGALTLSNATVNVKGFAGGFVINNGTIALSGNAAFLATNALSGVDIGHSGTGRLTMTGGRLIVIDEEVGTFPGDVGTLTLAGGTNVVTTDGLFVGDSMNATGTIWVTGGTLVETNATVFVGNLGFGAIIVSNGFVEAKTIKVANGTGATGGLNLVGGTTTVASNLIIGTSACTATGTVTVAGGSLFVTNATTNAVCDVRSGTLQLDSGTLTLDQLVLSNACGQFANNGGTFVLTGSMMIDQGTATFDGGTNQIGSNIVVGASANATGIVNVVGGALVVTNGVVGIGNNGSLFSTGGVAHVTVSSGLVRAASILIGDRTGGDSGFMITSNAHVLVHGGLRSNGIKTTTINGGTLEVVDGPPPPFEDPALHDRIVVAYLGDGRMIVSNGTVRGLEMVVGLSDGGGTFEMAGGSVNLSSNLLVGMNSTATGMVTITGGTLIVTNGVFAVGNNGTIGGAGGLGRVVVSNGIVEAASILVGDSTGGDSGLTVAGSGYVRAHGGLRSNGIKTTLVNGGTLEVVDGPPPPFEDPILHDRIVVSYLADGKLIVSNGTVRTPGMLVGASAGNAGTVELPGGSTSVFSNMTVGLVACTSTGIVNVAGGSLYVTNGGTAMLEVRGGTLTLSAGTVIADNLIVTNACGRLVHTGGTLVYSQLVLDPNLSAVGDDIANGWKQQYGLDPFDPNLGSKDADGDGMNNLQEYLAGTDPTNSVSAFRVTSITRLGNDVRVTWSTGSGKTNALQITGGPGFTTNFVDLFTVTNTVGSGTNYLDIGGATNMPARFYRVRLVP